MGIPNPEISGLLLVDKPAGMTSHDAVAIVRRAVKTRRVGHAGTLDPFATGLLVMLVGRGTRLIPFIDDEPKVYEATISFGSETDTDDLTGSVVKEAPSPDDPSIAEAITRLTGDIEQMPPAYSAKKVHGVRAYDAARRGKPLDLDPVRVRVHEIRMVGRTDRGLRIRVTCAGGTYIRALARDLGRMAGSAAHLVELRRVRSGSFDVADAMSIEQIRSAEVHLRPLRAAVPTMPVQRVTEMESRRVRHGNAVPAAVDGSRIALLDEESLIAVAERVSDELRPVLVLCEP
jgi:tRNA pseudouridine55 synthase